MVSVPSLFHLLAKADVQADGQRSAKRQSLTLHLRNHSIDYDET